MGDICGQCGRSVSSPGLCFLCDQHRRRLESAAEGTLRAAERTADIERQRAEVEFDREQRREEKREEREERREEKKRERERKSEMNRKQTALKAWIMYPDTIKAIFKSVANTDDGKLAALQQIAHYFNWNDENIEGTLGELYNTSPLEAELAYTRIRKVLVPFVVGFWRIRQRFPPASSATLQHLAKCLIYKDMSGVILFQKEWANRVSQLEKAQIPALQEAWWKIGEKCNEKDKQATAIFVKKGQYQNMCTLLVIGCSIIMICITNFYPDSISILVTGFFCFLFFPILITYILERCDRQLKQIKKDKNQLELEMTQAMAAWSRERERVRQEILGLRNVILNDISESLDPELYSAPMKRPVHDTTDTD
jgi:hypothetical protein